MAIAVDGVTNLSVMLIWGNPGWIASLATQLDGASEESNVTDYEFADMRWRELSLVETEILVTAWLGGRGFVIRTPWHTTELTAPESLVFRTEAAFVRQ